MRTTESVLVDAVPAAVFPFVATLDRYPSWMRLVHDARPSPPTNGVGHGDDGADDRDGGVAVPAWTVELRARVGPFARSKRLRMARTRHQVDELVEFERAEVDGRDHARWALCVELEPSGERSTLVTMHLAYDGRLWTGGLLQRVLDDEIRRGREALGRVVTGEPTR